MSILDRLTGDQYAKLVQYVTDAVTTFEGLARYARKTECDDSTSAADVTYCKDQVARGRQLLEKLGVRHGH